MGRNQREIPAPPKPAAPEGIAMIEAHLRRGYTVLMNAREAGLDPDGWDALVKDVLHLPLSMLPAVKRAVSKGVWQRANDPIRCVRENAKREGLRMFGDSACHR